jgi:hypothetical protein
VKKPRSENPVLVEVDVEFTPPSAELLPVWTVAKLLKQGKKAPHVELGRTLAAIATFYSRLGYIPARFQTAINVPVPVELLALVVEVLGGRSTWSEAENQARAEAARDRYVQIRQAAEKVRQKHPMLANSDLAIAKKMAADPAIRPIITMKLKNDRSRIMSVHAIRKIIARPKK